MGRNIPKGRIKQIQYFESLIDTWQDNPAAIGLTVAQVTSLETELTQARSTYTDVVEARTHARALTAFFHERVDQLHTSGSALIQVIKGFAATSANPAAILSAANVLAANAPGAGTPPEQPSIRDFKLLGTGALRLEWTARGPSGTVYLVSRKIKGESSPTILGTGTKKKFTDRTVPAGTISATYYVQAIRGNMVSPSSIGTTVAFSCSAGSQAKATPHLSREAA